MRYENGFPKTMVHPAYAPAVVAHGGGAPARFPPVTVNTPDQEAELRAKGYVAQGEGPKRMSGFHEYPIMLYHPDWTERVSEERIPMRDAAGNLVWTLKPGAPEKNGPVQARNEIEEAAWNAKGWKRAHVSDRSAFDTAKASPAHAGGYVPVEYPKYVQGQIVNSLEEEVAVMRRILEGPSSGQVTIENGASASGHTPPPESGNRARNPAPSADAEARRKARSDKMKEYWANKKAAEQPAA